MASASDDFNRADAGTLGANWTAWAPAGDGPDIVSNQAKGGLSASINAAFYSGVSFAGDHEAQVTKGNASDYQGPAIRMAAATGYVYFNHGSIQKVIAGVNSQIAAATSFASGNTAKIRIIDDDLEWWKNGSSDGTVTDASIGSGGAPGVYFYDNTGTVDGWSATDDFGGGSILPLVAKDMSGNTVDMKDMRG